MPNKHVLPHEHGWQPKLQIRRKKPLTLQEILQEIKAPSLSSMIKMVKFDLKIATEETFSLRG